MKRFVVASFCTMCFFSFVLADEFTAVITKVEGNKVTYFKAEPDPNAAGKKGGKKGGGALLKKGDAITAKAIASPKVVKGGKNQVDVDGGLTNEMFKTIDVEKGVPVTLTIADDGKDKGMITQIAVKGGGGGKKGGAKGGNQQ